MELQRVPVWRDGYSLKLEHIRGYAFVLLAVDFHSSETITMKTSSSGRRVCLS